MKKLRNFLSLRNVMLLVGAIISLSMIFGLRFITILYSVNSDSMLESWRVTFQDPIFGSMRCAFWEYSFGTTQASLIQPGATSGIVNGGITVSYSLPLQAVAIFGSAIVGIGAFVTVLASDNEKAKRIVPVVCGGLLVIFAILLFLTPIFLKSSYDQVVAEIVRLNPLSATVDFNKCQVYSRLLNSRAVWAIIAGALIAGSSFVPDINIFTIPEQKWFQNFMAFLSKVFNAIGSFFKKLFKKNKKVEPKKSLKKVETEVVESPSVNVEEN